MNEGQPIAAQVVLREVHNRAVVSQDQWTSTIFNASKPTSVSRGGRVDNPGSGGNAGKRGSQRVAPPPPPPPSPPAGKKRLLLQPVSGSQKMRPVINLKKLNAYMYIPHHHFKMEGIQNPRELLRKDDWITKVDLKDAYFMVPMDRGSRDFLQFTNQSRHYQFTCLPFGLSCAPWVFTKILRPAAQES